MWSFLLHFDFLIQWCHRVTSSQASTFSACVASITLTTLCSALTPPHSALVAPSRVHSSEWFVTFPVVKQVLSVITPVQVIVWLGPFILRGFVGCHIDNYWWVERGSLCFQLSLNSLDLRVNLVVLHTYSLALCLESFTKQAQVVREGLCKDFIVILESLHHSVGVQFAH